MKTGRVLLVAWGILSLAWIGFVTFFGWSLFEAVDATAKAFFCAHCTTGEAGGITNIGTGWAYVFLYVFLPGFIPPLVALAVGVGVREIARAVRARR